MSAALLVEQRRHAESLVRAFGLPTRNEVDALYAHVKELTPSARASCARRARRRRSAAPARPRRQGRPDQPSALPA